MIELPDLRVIDSRPCPALLAPLADHTTADAPALARLADAVRALLDAGDETSVRQLLDWRGPPWLNRAVRRAVQSVLDASPDDALRLQIFFLPVVLVAGARAPAVLPMMMAQAGDLASVFEAAGAVGPSRQLAFHAALCDEATLERLSLVDLYRRARLATGNVTPLELPACPLPVPAGQTVALRFLAGTTLVARGAPGFGETAGDVARWGAALTRELTGQLTMPGVTLLPLARPPRGLLAALALGRFCREEVACQLTLGDHLRDMRARYGDASASLCSGAQGVDVALHSPWSDQPRSHRWSLDGESDLREVCESIETFLQRCGVTGLSVAASSPGGAH